MFRKVDDLIMNWKYESGCTQKLFDQLTDQSLAQTVSDGHRTLGRLAWHIVVTIPEMMGRTGLKVTTVDHTAPVPRTAAEIKKAYASVAQQLLDQIQAGWKDDTLLVEDNMYGEQWMRGMTAQALIKHEVHHRGQMTVLMRQAGLKVPGVYGPSKEEWVNYGAPAPEI